MSPKDPAASNLTPPASSLPPDDLLPDGTSSETADTDMQRVRRPAGSGPMSAAGLPGAERRWPNRPDATVQANGLLQGYDVCGEGEPLVLLHGATSESRADWAEQVEMLARRFRVYLLDARGHATTRWLPGTERRLSPELMEEDLRAFIQVLDLGPVHLAGFSLGAGTVLSFAARHPELTRSVVAIGVALPIEPRLTVARHVLNVERIERSRAAWIPELEERHDPFHGPGAWRQLCVDVFDAISQVWAPSQAFIHQVEAPLLVVVGDRDPFIRVHDAADLARLVVGGRLFVVPGGSHPVMLTHPAIFNPGLDAFYTDVLEAEAAATADNRPLSQVWSTFGAARREGSQSV